MRVDRTSNRRWKRRRNWQIIIRGLLKLNHCQHRGDLLEAVMQTRPGLDRRKVKRLLSRLLIVE